MQFSSMDRKCYGNYIFRSKRVPPFALSIWHRVMEDHTQLDLKGKIQLNVAFLKPPKAWTLSAVNISLFL